MVDDIRWKQRYEIFKKAFSRLNEVLQDYKKEPKNHTYQIALACAFQFTFELSWKTIKEYLVYKGLEVNLPRDVIKQAFHHEIIREGDGWISMLEDRNVIQHCYDEELAVATSKKIDELYAPHLQKWHDEMQQHFKEL